MKCDDEAFLQEELYNMAIRHIAYITPQQGLTNMTVFVRSIIGVIRQTLEDQEQRWNDDTENAWSGLFKFLGDALLYNLAEFSGKVRTIRNSWRKIVGNTEGLDSRRKKQNTEN